MSISENALSTWPGAARAAEAAGVDGTLIRRCLAGEEVAYTALYERYAAYVYRLCYSLLQQREDAEEVVQDTFAYAFRKLDRYDPGRASFKTWLYQIAVSRARNKRRRKWLPTFSLSQWLGERLPDTHHPTPDQAMALSGRQRQIWKALQALSPKLRETAVLRYYEELSYREIGEILEIPAKTAESRMRLAHQALKRLLTDEETDEGME